MIIIGERINTVRKSIAEAIEKRDAEALQKEALAQVEAGIDVLDVNAGTRPKREPADLAWAIEAVQEVVDVPLCLDSSNPRALIAAYDVCHNKDRAWANSITAERERFDPILPLVREYNCPVVALCVDETGYPRSAEDRVRVARKLIEIVTRYDIPLERLYIDCLIEPIGADHNRGPVVLDSVRLVKEALPQVKTLICLSAISHGLPNRRLLNRTFMPLLMRAGLDAVILDPLDRKLRAVIMAAEAVLGQDEYCLNYIAAHRAGTLE